MPAAYPFQYAKTIGFLAERGRGFNNPVDLALDSTGALYVLNRGGTEAGRRLAFKRISRCTLAEDYLGEFSSGGTDAGQLWWPSSLAFDRSDRLYVADEALHRITIFDRAGAFLDQWGQPGSGPGQLNRPSYLTFDQQDNLLIADSLNHRLQQFTKEGAFLRQWGGYGSGPGQFNMPWGIAVAEDGRLYIADWRNDRIQCFDAAGNFMACFGESGYGEGQLYRPAGLAVDAAGYLYIADWGNQRVQIFDRDGQFIAAIRGDASIPSQWAADYLAANPEEAAARRQANLEPAVARRPEQTPAEYEWERSAAVEKLLWGPTAVKLDAAGHIYIVDSLRHRLQVYRWAD